jgi:hypothetical protein
MAVVNPPAYIQASSHPADVFRRALRALRENTGVVLTGDLAVAQNGSPNMSVNVAAGIGVIDGTENAVSQGTYVDLNDATVNLAIAAADPTNPRNDLVVMKVQDAQYSGATNAASLVVVQGTPAGSPVDPATPANAIVLARVRVNAGVSSITNAVITDLRTSAQGQIIPGAAGFQIRSSDNSRANWAEDDNGLITQRNAMKVPPSVGGTVAPTSYGSVPIKIDEQTPSGVATINVGGAVLPTGFRHLLLEIVGRGDTAAGFVECGLRFNADAGNNYGWERLDATGAVAAASESGAAAQSSGRAWFLSAANALAATPGIARIWIPNYGGTTFKKLARIDWGFFVGAAFPAAGELTSDYTTIFWNNAAAITRLDLITLAGNFVAGTTITLYGIP